MPAKYLAYFNLALDDNTQHWIELGAPRPSSIMEPELVAQVFPNGSVQFTGSPQLELADIQLVAWLAADYEAGRLWLREQVTPGAQRIVGTWLPILWEVVV